MRAATPPEPRRPHHKRRSAGTDTTRRPTEPVGGPDVLSNVRSERVRAVAALGRRSVRVREGLFLAEGPQAVREAVRCRPDAVREIYTDAAGRERCEEILADAAAAGIPVRDTTAQVLAAMCDTSAPQGVLAVCRPVDTSLEAVLARDPRLLVVATTMRDPGNAGTVIRGADAAGADAVLVGTSSVDVYNPKVVRSAVGSHFHVPLVLGLDVPALLDRLRERGIRSLAADGTAATSLFDADLVTPHAWVMGNEAWGLPSQLLDACDEAVAVPLYGQAESLNLAMAATVCLYASARAQRA